MEIGNVVKLILDYRNNPVTGNFSKEDNKETIRQALIEANGGSSKLDLKTLLRGRTDLFTIIETVVDRTVSEGLKGDEFFMNMVEERNLAYGDQPKFTADVNTTLVVADAARGTQGIRRQRFGEKTSVTLTPTPKVIKIYEELSRLLAGTADINDLIDAVTKAVKLRRLDDIYAAWNGITAANITVDYYPVAGAYDEDTLLDLINHVSAANDGAKCMLVCTLKGARKLSTGIISNSAREDYYKNGYAMNWNGINVQIVPQRHTVGTNTFIFDDDKVYVIPVGMDKPVKQVASGESLLIVGNPTDNADLTQEFSLITEWVTGVFTGKKFGVYETL
jgi:hypothetical protein